VLTLNVLPHVKILGVVPLLPLFFIIALSYFRKGFEPLIIAALCGIFFDLFSSYPFGLYLILFLLVSSLVRYLFQEGMRNLSFWFFMLLSFFGMSFYYVAQLLMLFREHVTLSWGYLVPIGLGFLVNGVFAFLLYLFSEWYFDRLLMLEEHLKRR
jgi:rod shape-determining protein MreD